MNSLLVKFVCALFLAATTPTFATPLKEGGMSGGGGGGVFPGSPVTELEIVNILIKARLEVFMVLSLQSLRTDFPWPELFEGEETIFDVIFQYRIYASQATCRDLHGNPTDGSIYSPVYKTICISVGNLTKKLTTDSVRAQVLALVVHEYSHLKGFDEAKARSLQFWFTPVFANASSAQANNLLEFMSQQTADIANYVEYNNDNRKTPGFELSWDYICFVSEKMLTALTIFDQQFTDNPFSVSQSELYKKQNSFLVKQTAIRNQVCALSQYHPEKEKYKKWTTIWFKDSNQIYDHDVVQAILTNKKFNVHGKVLILGQLPLRRIQTFEDFDLEFLDMQTYVTNELRRHINRLWTLIAMPAQ